MAVQELDSESIKDGGILTQDIADSAITAAKIAAGVVGTVHISLAAITAPLIAANAVGTGALQLASVISDRIADLNVTTAKLADLGTTTGKIALGAIVSDRIAAGAVILGKIGPSAVDSTALAANAVSAPHIQANAVTTVKILDRNVTANKIALNSIDNSLLSTGELHFAADTTSLSNKKVVFNLEISSTTLTAGPSVDLTSQLSAETPVTSASSTEGVIIDPPKNSCILRDQNTQPIADGGGREVFGRLTFASGVWTLTYRVIISGTEQNANLSSAFTGAKVLVPKRFNLLTSNEDSFRGAAVFSNNTTALSSHITQPTGAHLASAIAVVDAGNRFTTDNVEAALSALAGAGWVEGTNDSLRAHQTRAVGAHAATAISFTPLGSRTTPLTSSEVNDAIEDLHGEVEALQAAPAPVVFGFKYVLSSAAQTVIDVTSAPNAPFVVGDNSLMVFYQGTLQSISGGHYTENAGGFGITFSVPISAGKNVVLVWHKAG